MVNPTIERELHGYLNRMPAELQREVMNFARTLVTNGPSRKVSGNDLVRFAGTIDPSDAILMSQAIEEGCERVNPGDWQ